MLRISATHPCQSRATDKGAVVEGDIDQAFVSFPSLFKHVAFDGRFLHGVPEQMRRIVKREGHDVRER